MGDYYQRSRGDAMLRTKEVRPGFLSMIKEMVLSGIVDGQFAPHLGKHRHPP